MDKYSFDFLLLGHLQQREQMMDVRMHAAVAQQAQKMQAPLPPALHRPLKQQHVLQLFFGDHQINSRDVHVHDASRAHVHVAHFTVAHLAFRQAHERS